MIDLHCHSTCSDGSDSPSRVVELAAAAGCAAVALTDHDGLGGIIEARKRADELGIELLPGCEVSCAFSPGTMHVLCYFVEPSDGPLQNELSALQDDRSSRNAQLIARLNELDIPITLEQVGEKKAKGSTIGRPHFASVLVDMGLVGSINEAFERYLAKGAPAYISKARVEAHEIIALTTRSQGICVLAHPLSLDLDTHELEATVAELAEQGLSGLECYYGRYDKDERAQLVAMARRHGLVPTGGSDYHGTYKADLSMGTGTGDLCVPDDVIDELLSRCPTTSANEYTR